MHLREQELIHLHWTRPIEKEWARNVVAKQGADRDAIQNCLRGMREAVEDWEVDGFERYEANFEAVDEKDRHVAAAAFKLSKEEWIPNLARHCINATARSAATGLFTAARKP